MQANTPYQPPGLRVYYSRKTIYSFPPNYISNQNERFSLEVDSFEKRCRLKVLIGNTIKSALKESFLVDSVEEPELDFDCSVFLEEFLKNGMQTLDNLIELEGEDYLRLGLLVGHAKEEVGSFELFGRRNVSSHSDRLLTGAFVDQVVNTLEGDSRLERCSSTQRAS